MSQTAVEAAESRSPVATRVIVERGIGFLLLALVAVFVLANAVMHTSEFFSVFFFGLNLGALYALVALGYTLVYGIIELINFSHGDLFMLATVGSGFAMVSWLNQKSASVGAFALMIGAMILVMAGAAAINTAAERVAYRRLRRAPKLAPLITAVGLSFAYQWAGITVNGSGQRNWATLLGSSGFTVAGVKVQWSVIVVVGVTIPLLLLMTYVIQKTRQGKAMRATA